MPAVTKFLRGCPLTRRHSLTSALGDSSLWTIIHLKVIFPPQYNPGAGNRPFPVYVNHRDLGRLARLWTLVEQTPKNPAILLTFDNLPHFSPPSILCSTSKPSAFDQSWSRIGEQTPQICLLFIFSGCSPLLRDLTFTNADTRSADIQGPSIFQIGCFRPLPRLPC